MSAPSASAGPRLLGPADVRELAAALGLRPTKKRGQNFVVDANTVRRIVATAGVQPEEHVLEVGPGLGSLTLGLLAAGARVTAVEIDPALASLLPQTVAARAPDAAARLTVVTGDAARVDVDGTPSALVANLPYNVAVPIVLHLAASVPSLTTGLVMVQREVAERLAAPPGSRTYGVPSVKCAWFFSARLAGGIGRSVFWPVPNVDSALVALHRREPPSGGVDRAATFAVVDAAFTQRRKMLRSSLGGLIRDAQRDPVDVLTTAGVDPEARAERLDVADFARIAEALAS